jgi:hypothetical protein
VKRRVLNPRVLVVSSLLMILIVGGAAATILISPGAARAALLSVFLGSASIQRGGASAPAAGHTGDELVDGDSVATSEDGKAALTYPDGSITRLDSNTRVLVHVTQAGNATRTNLVQSAGLTWNTVKRLAGGSTFDVTGPNSATAEVRGTRFGYYVEHDTANNPVVWIDVYDGVVGVTGSKGQQVLATAGQRVTVRPAAAPTTPAPIPDGDLRLSFTVFNQTIEAVTGKPFAFQSGTLGTGDASVPLAVQADGKSDLQFVLGWPNLPGSRFALTVIAPDGHIFSTVRAASPPLLVVARKAAAGTWTVTVDDVQSALTDNWWVIVGRS